MSVLAANLRSTQHPRLQARKEEWASRLEAAAQTQTQAAKALDAAELEVMRLAMRRRGLAQAAQVMLTRLKREFKNVGMSQAQIHEIIPGSPRGRRAPAEPEAEVPAEASAESDTAADEPAPESAPRSVG